MKKILFFDVADYEVEYLAKACAGKFEYELIKESLSSILEIKRKDLRSFSSKVFN